MKGFGGCFGSQGSKWMSLEVRFSALLSCGYEWRMWYSHLDDSRW